MPRGLESIWNTWVLLRIRLKFLRAGRIGWSSARGLVLLPSCGYSREKPRFISLEFY